MLLLLVAANASKIFSSYYYLGSYNNAIKCFLEPNNNSTYFDKKVMKMVNYLMNLYSIYPFLGTCHTICIKNHFFGFKIY